MRTLIAALFLALPVAAQQESAPATAPVVAPKVVVVQAGATARPAPTRIVHVAPSAVRAPSGAYEGTRPRRDWTYYANGGPARARASYAVWRTRFAPVSSHAYYPARYATHVYRARCGW